MELCIVSRNIIKGDGQSRVNYEIAWEAIRGGHRLTLLASSVAPELHQNQQVTWIDIPVKGWPTQLLSSLVFSGRSADWLRQHRQDVDILQVNGANTREPADVNAVHFVHSSWLRSPVHPSRLHKNPNSVYQWLYTRLNADWEKKAFQQAKAIVAVSEKVKQELIDIGVPPKQIRTILNGVDLQEFSPGFADRRQLGLPDGVTLALFVGDIRTNRKNLETVLHALARVPELHLAVVGATEKSPYPQLAAKLQLSKRVHFLGYRRDIPELMKAADLFVFPSRYEACTLVVLEAMATGLPIITASTAGGSEIITPECGVVLPDSDNVQALAEVLDLLADNPARRKLMGQAARKAAEQHSWQKMAQSYLDLFEEVNKS